MKAVFYIIPSWIGSQGYLTWDQCREMHKTELVDFQSHSYDHCKVITDLKIQDVRHINNGDRPLYAFPGLNIKYYKENFEWIPLFRGESLFKVSSYYHLPMFFWKKCAEISINLHFFLTYLA